MTSVLYFGEVIVTTIEATLSWDLPQTKHYVKCSKYSILFNALNNPTGCTILILFRKEQTEHQTD